MKYIEKLRGKDWPVSNQVIKKNFQKMPKNLSFQPISGKNGVKSLKRWNDLNHKNASSAAANYHVEAGKKYVDDFDDWEYIS